MCGLGCGFDADNKLAERAMRCTGSRMQAASCSIRSRSIGELDALGSGNATRVLAMAHSFGIKVMFSVVGDDDYIMNCTSTGCDSEELIRAKMPRLFQMGA
jgi:hypothetical protein